MQCKCGGETRTSEAIQSKMNARLAFYECKSCLRVSNAELFIRDTLVATDPAARASFGSLDKTTADALYAEATQPAEPEKQFTTGELF